MIHRLCILILVVLPLHGLTQLLSSHLPIVVINTGSEIPDEPKVSGTMGITADAGNNTSDDVFLEYDGQIGIETRGNSTQGFDKKSYTVQLRDSLGVAQESDLFGMGADSDWILHAMYIDKTLLRIPMSFYLFERMGHYATEWKFVELIINGQYRGVYLLCEKIKASPSRVNIKNDLSDVSGGYILRIDWLDEVGDISSDYNSMGGIDLRLQHEFPKGSLVDNNRKEYLKTSLRQFEYPLFSANYLNNEGIHYSNYADVSSFASVFLINELSKNSDGYKLSSFIHKNSDDIDSKWHAGPIWDFDQTYGLSAVCSGSNPCGWLYLQNQNACEDFQSMPMWWDALTGDEVFSNELVLQWTQMRSDFLHIDSIYSWIDQHVSLLDSSIDRNFTRWPILNEDVWITDVNPPGTYEGEIEYMKNWIARRIEWMDNNIAHLQDFSSADNKVKIYPNPHRGLTYVKAVPGASLRVCDMRGRELFSSKACETAWTFSTENWTSGVYQVFVTSDQGTFTGQLVVQ